MHGTPARISQICSARLLDRNEPIAAHIGGYFAREPDLRLVGSRCARPIAPATGRSAYIFIQPGRARKCTLMHAADRVERYWHRGDLARPLLLVEDA